MAKPDLKEFYPNEQNTTTEKSGELHDAVQQSSVQKKMAVKLHALNMLSSVPSMFRSSGNLTIPHIMMCLNLLANTACIEQGNIEFQSTA